MEHQARYNLDAALEAWRAELAAQPNLTAEVRRELETHLHDALAGFRQRGLSDEEAFWLARRRVGQPAQLGEEFFKANPLAVWRERLFWMAAALLTYFIWSNLAEMLSILVTNQIFDWLSPYRQAGLVSWLMQSSVISVGSQLVLRYVPLILAAIFVATGRIKWNALLRGFLGNRGLVAALCTGLILLHEWLMYNGYNFGRRHIHTTAEHMSGPVLFLNLAYNVFWPLVLTAVTVWLMPAPNRKSAQPT